MSSMEVLLFCLGVFGLTSFCIAGFHTVKSLKALERSIDRYDYAVVFVYEYKKGQDLAFKRIDDMFERLSNKGDYTDAQIAFLKINEKNIETITHDYALSQLPAFFILKKGRLIGNDSNRAILYGYPTRLELTNFIDEWIGSEVDSIVQAEKDRREREQERSSSNVSINYDIGLGWGPSYYPGYYWDWPYYRPGYYGGWGYGGWGWRRHHHGGHRGGHHGGHRHHR